MRVITSADVQFSAQNQVKTKKTKRSSRSQAVVCTKTSQPFSRKNDLTCFHCPKCRKGGHLGIFWRPRRTFFFGLKGGHALQTEDVW